MTLSSATRRAVAIFHCRFTLDQLLALAECRPETGLPRSPHGWWGGSVSARFEPRVIDSLRRRGLVKLDGPLHAVLTSRGKAVRKDLRRHFALFDQEEAR